MLGFTPKLLYVGDVRPGPGSEVLLFFSSLKIDPHKKILQGRSSAQISNLPIVGKTSHILVIFLLKSVAADVKALQRFVRRVSVEAFLVAF